MMLAANVTGAQFQNPVQPLDVSDDGIVSPRDALLVIADLNAGGPRPLERAEGESDSLRAVAISAPTYVDVNGDRMLDNSDALTVIRALNAGGEPGDVVTFRLETTDLLGAAVTQVDVGDEFLLRVTTQDNQATADLFGVFAAYLDVEFNSSLATALATPQFDGEYVNGTSGDIATAGLINEAGAFAGFDETGRDEQEVFTVRMRADSAGELVFTSNPADRAGNEVLVYGSPDDVNVNDILYGTTTLTVLGPTQTPATDLAGFARNLGAAGVELWSTRFSAVGTVAEQLNAFEDGEAYLPFREMFDANGNLTSAAVTAGVSVPNTWIFPDESRSEGPLLTLQEISERSETPIPLGVNPSIAPIADVTVLQGSPLHIPLDGYDPNGDPLTYTITVGNQSLLTTFIPQDNRSLRMTVGNEVGVFGDMVFELFEGRAPRATEHIIELATREPVSFYEGLTFHRVIDGFVIQGGDPLGTGAGGSDLGDFDDQFNVDLQHNRDGVLSMAKSLDDTNDSQFFVTEISPITGTGPRTLDFQHTIFGQLIEGFRVRETTSNVETGPGDRPLSPVTMTQVEVFEDLENAVVMLTALQGSGTTDVTVTATDTVGNSTSETFTVTLGVDQVNGQPFLRDIPEQVFTAGETIEFEVSAIDVEGDPVTFSASTTVAGASASANAAGLVTVIPPAGFAGTLPVRVRVTPTNNVPRNSMDDQLVNVRILPAAPTSLDLLADSDAGLSATDNVTSLSELQFQVTGVANGATVKLLLDGETEIGQGVASGDSITITTTNLSALGDGPYLVMAVQEINGDQSAQSPAIGLVLDQTPPVAITNAAPTEASVGVPYTYDAAHPEEGTSGFLYSLAVAPAGMSVSETTGVVTWTPTTAQRGAQAYELVVTDLAGNSTSRTIDVAVGAGGAEIRLVATDLNGNPIGGVGPGVDFLLQVFASDLRGTATGLSDVFLDVAFNSALATVNGAIDFGDDYPDDRSGDTATPGLIDEIGASTSVALGGGEFLVATIPMRAGTTTGTVAFAGDPADEASHQVLFAGDSTPLTGDDLTLVGATLSILAVGDELTANPDAAAVDEDTRENLIDVLANDTLGPDSEIVEVSAATSPDMSGVAEISGDRRSIIYTPAPDFFGDETFTYTIRDGLGVTDTAEVTVTVNPINDPPHPNDDFFPQDFQPGDVEIDQLFEDSTARIALRVISNDSQEPDSDVDGREIFFISSVGLEGTAGTVAFEQLGVFYTPAPDFFGVDTFTYTVTDLHNPPLQGTATVTVTVPEVNDAPIANTDQFSVLRSTPLEITAAEITGNDAAGPANESAQTLTVVEVFGASSGTVVLNGDGSVTYTPNNGFVGTDSFTYRIRDNGTTRGEDDFLEATGTVELSVGQGNTPPQAFDDAVSIVGDSEAITLSLLANDLTSDSGETLQITGLGTLSAGGTATIINDGAAVSYRPAAGFVGTETFTYTVSDGSLSDTASVTVTVTDPATSTNSLFGGLVFFDADNDGQRDDGEAGIGGVTIRLEGTDSNGNQISRVQVTDNQGAWQFSTLPRGSFTVTQEQPSFLLDGTDTADATASSADKNSFAIQVADAVVTSGNNMFAERGLSPKFAMLDALASGRRHAGFLTATSGGSSQWVRDVEGWDEFSSINVALSDDLSQVVITAVNKDSEQVRATVPATDKSRVALLGRDGDTVLLRIVAAAADFNLTPVVQSGSGVASSAAVDAVFAGN